MSLPPSFLLALCAAMCLLAAGVALLGYAQYRQRVQEMSRHMDQLLAAMPMYPAPDQVVLSNSRAQPSWLPPWLVPLLAPRQAILVLSSVVLVTAVVAMTITPLAGVFAGFVMLLLLAGWVWMRWQRRRRLLLAQLPMFLDTMVRLIGLGHSTQSAFQQAASSVKMPLRELMERASGLTRAGMELETALANLSEQEHLSEFQLLASMVRVSVRYGGRVDTLMERVSHFMRDREQAEQELSSLTAETRLSAWVLSLLPIVVGGMIIVLNGAYFMRMWTDPTGRQLILVAVALQVIGVVLLYRLARLD